MRKLILNPLKLLVLTIAAGALAVSAATAAPTKGKPSGPKPCHGKAKVTEQFRFAKRPRTAPSPTRYSFVESHGKPFRASRRDERRGASDPPGPRVRLRLELVPD